MTVHGRGMLGRDVEQFLLAIGGNGDGAFGFARKLAAVDEFACHDDLHELVLQTDCKHDELRFKRRKAASFEEK